MENKYFKIDSSLTKILEHHSSQKIKNKQSLPYIQELIHDAKNNNTHSFTDCSSIKESLIELYKSFYLSYPTMDIINQHASVLEDLRKQFTEDQETTLFLETAILQTYAMHHDETYINATCP